MTVKYTLVHTFWDYLVGPIVNTQESSEICMVDSDIFVEIRRSYVDKKIRVIKR